MLHTWSQLGLPLIICFRMPTMATETAASSGQIVNDVRSNLVDAQRLELLSKLLPMLIARPVVHGFIWRQWNDADDLRFPGGGLFTEKNEIKPVLDIIRASAAHLTAE
jgi:hypothetical protein